MDFSQKIRHIQQTFNRFMAVDESKLLVLTTENEEVLLAKKENNVWRHIPSDYDSIPHFTGILEVDVNNQENIDLPSIAQDLMDKLKKSMQADLELDFQIVSEYCLTKVENKPITVLKSDSDEMAVINSMLKEIINPWLASPCILFGEFEELKRKYELLKTLVLDYLEIKVNFDDYLEAILPVYKQVLFSQKVDAPVALQRQECFLENLEFLKQMTVKEARANINQVPNITKEKLEILFNKKMENLEAVLQVLNS